MTENMKDVEDIISEIIALEWKQFDNVQNEGGRAACQDNWETFRIMRRSQFLCWPEDLLNSYLRDLIQAESDGWNLLTEKYARMMESTAPEEFDNLKDRLPARSRERLSRQEKVIETETRWNEEVHQRFPKYSAGSRPIHTAEDTPWQTSSETYLRGELSTYSDETFGLYESWIDLLKKDGQNKAYLTADNTARQYGYDSLEAVEKIL